MRVPEHPVEVRRRGRSSCSAGGLPLRSRPLAAPEKTDERIRGVHGVEEKKKGGVSCFGVPHLAGN